MTRGFTMTETGRRLFPRTLVFRSGLAVPLLISGAAGGPSARAEDDGVELRPGNLLVSRVIYDNNPKNVEAGVTLLPPNCIPPACAIATDGGAYPTVWNNALVDSSFGIASKIVLDQLKPSGMLVSSLELPNSSQRRV